MLRIRLDTDLRPVTEFRANAAALIAQVRETKRPLVLTQRGRGAVVLVAVEEYEKMLEVAEAPTGGAHSAAVGTPSRAAAPSGTSVTVPSRVDDPVEAYKNGIDRTLIRENLGRPVAERLRRLAEMAEFSEALRRAPRRPATRFTRGSAAPPGRDSS